MCIMRNGKVTLGPTSKFKVGGITLGRERVYLGVRIADTHYPHFPEESEDKWAVIFGLREDQEGYAEVADFETLADWHGLFES